MVSSAGARLGATSMTFAAVLYRRQGHRPGTGRRRTRRAHLRTATDGPSRQAGTRMTAALLCTLRQDRKKRTAQHAQQSASSLCIFHSLSREENSARRGPQVLQSQTKRMSSSGSGHLIAAFRSVTTPRQRSENNSSRPPSSSILQHGIRRTRREEGVGRACDASKLCAR